MNPLTQPVRCRSTVVPASAALSFLLALCGYFVAGCGGSSGGSTITVPPPPPGPTSVTMVVSSTANDQFENFYVDVTSITLASQSGATVTVLAAPPQSQPVNQIQEAEFIHLNGQTAPFLAAMIPQDTYTSATLTYGYAQFTHLRLNGPGSLEIVTDAAGGVNSIAQTASVNLPVPLVIRGTGMAVSLDLQVSTSATFTDHGAARQDTYAITPIFTLAAVAAPPQSQVKITGVDALISSIKSGNSLSLMIDYAFNNPTYPDGSTFTVATNASTVYQGVGNFSALTAGMIANVDVALQSDGSLLATRIEVDDLNATNVLTGPLQEVFSAQSQIQVLGRTNEEFNQTAVPGSNFMPYSFDVNTAFMVSAQVAVPSNLSFSPVFDRSGMIAGQNVAVGSQVIVTSGSTFTHATTITLMPQTINGTVSGVSSSGGFTVYTVSLAAYDLFPILAMQTGQTTVLANPASIEIYADSNAQMLNTAAIVAGTVVRFNGLIFNDNGTARMVCRQVQDGLAE